jgi:hypothetical protein
VCVQDRARTEKPDAGDDLRRDAGGVAERPAVGGEADLRDVDRQMREQRRADADQDVGAQARGLAGDLPLEADRAPEDGGEEQLQQQDEPERVAELGERLRRGRGEEGEWR